MYKGINYAYFMNPLIEITNPRVIIEIIWIFEQSKISFYRMNFLKGKSS